MTPTQKTMLKMMPKTIDTAIDCLTTETPTIVATIEEGVLISNEEIETLARTQSMNI